MPNTAALHSVHLTAVLPLRGTCTLQQCRRGEARAATGEARATTGEARAATGEARATTGEERATTDEERAATGEAHATTDKHVLPQARLTDTER